MTLKDAHGLRRWWEKQQREWEMPIILSCVYATLFADCCELQVECRGPFGNALVPPFLGLAAAARLWPINQLTSHSSRISNVKKLP